MIRLRLWKLPSLLLALFGLPASTALNAQQVSAVTTGSGDAGGGDAGGGLSVDLSSRQASLAFYQSVYLASENVPSGWTGNLAQGVAGTTAPAFQNAIAQRINYFRAMAGVPAVITLSDAYNAADQQAALMMSVNGQLNHNPPVSWLDYSADGAAAASHSDLYLGVNGPAAVSGYIEDPGDDNTSLGHRRWILYPQTTTMGSGDLESTSFSLLDARANALWVIDSNYYNTRPATRDGFVAWPPPGYVPYPLVFARWSFSYPNADFSQAHVSMTSGAKTLAVTQAVPFNGYGENTLAWTPQGVVLAADDPKSSVPVEQQEPTFQVTVSNVLVNGSATSFSYSVKPFDPAQAGTGQPPVFFASERSLGSGVYYLGFPSGNYFGYYAYLSDPHFIYHFDMGYEYAIDAKDGQDGVYLYDFKSGSWFYTSPNFGFPYLYDFSLNSVLYYYPDSNNAGRYNTNGVRYFYDFGTGQIVTR